MYIENPYADEKKCSQCSASQWNVMVDHARERVKCCRCAHSWNLKTDREGNRRISEETY